MGTCSSQLSSSGDLDDVPLASLAASQQVLQRHNEGKEGYHSHGEIRSILLELLDNGKEILSHTARGDAQVAGGLCVQVFVLACGDMDPAGKESMEASEEGGHAGELLASGDAIDNDAPDRSELSLTALLVLSCWLQDGQTAQRLSQLLGPELHRSLVTAVSPASLTASTMACCCLAFLLQHRPVLLQAAESLGLRRKLETLLWEQSRARWVGGAKMNGRDADTVASAQMLADANNYGDGAVPPERRHPFAWEVARYRKLLELLPAAAAVRCLSRGAGRMGAELSESCEDTWMNLPACLLCMMLRRSVALSSATLGGGGGPRSALSIAAAAVMPDGASADADEEAEGRTVQRIAATREQQSQPLKVLLTLLPQFQEHSFAFAEMLAVLEMALCQPAAAQLRRSFLASGGLPLLASMIRSSRQSQISGCFLAGLLALDELPLPDHLVAKAVTAAAVLLQNALAATGSGSRGNVPQLHNLPDDDMLRVLRALWALLLAHATQPAAEAGAATWPGRGARASPPATPHATSMQPALLRSCSTPALGALDHAGAGISDAPTRALPSQPASRRLGAADEVRAPQQAASTRLVGGPAGDRQLLAPQEADALVRRLMGLLRANGEPRRMKAAATRVLHALSWYPEVPVLLAQHADAACVRGLAQMMRSRMRGGKLGFGAGLVTHAAGGAAATASPHAAPAHLASRKAPDLQEPEAASIPGITLAASAAQVVLSLFEHPEQCRAFRVDGAAFAHAMSLALDAILGQPLQLAVAKTLLATCLRMVKAGAPAVALSFFGYGGCALVAEVAARAAAAPAGLPAAEDLQAELADDVAWLRLMACSILHRVQQELLQHGRWEQAHYVDMLLPQRPSGRSAASAPASAANGGLPRSSRSSSADASDVALEASAAPLRADAGWDDAENAGEQEEEEEAASTSASHAEAATSPASLLSARNGIASHSLQLPDSSNCSAATTATTGPHASCLAQATQPAPQPDAPPAAPAAPASASGDAEPAASQLPQAPELWQELHLVLDLDLSPASRRALLQEYGQLYSVKFCLEPDAVIDGAGVNV